ncbi:MAG: hypothetical protein M1331_01030 [Candidatus Marsarchaeota archaeon]|nr:hypothetical protein [Candidatus Marsarchaeota archaeon]MCL5105967.1 hypothetical protein [Candidatus Marsarchaeota archaeon]
MIEKILNKRLLIIIAAIALFSSTVNAETITAFCSQVINPGNLMFTFSPTNNTALLNTVILIISTMMALLGITYAIGSAFGIQKLIVFTKAEIGEILITGLIAFIFIQSISMFGSAKSGLSPVTNLFTKDCISMTSSSLGLMLPMLELSFSQLVLKTVSSISLSLYPVYMGYSVAPFSGFNIISTPMNIVIGLSGMLMMLLFGVSLVLGIIYAFFPIFLYLGIVLRALPWTRAAGGAFLGMFAGMFVMFPLLLNFGLTGPLAIPCATTSPTTTVPVSSTSPTNFCNNPSATAQSQITSAFQPSGFTGVADSLDSFVSITSGGILVPPIEFITKDILEPLLYSLIILVFSLIISFSFMEEVGKLLGATSLSSKHMLKKVI